LRARTWGIILLVNALISAAVVLTVIVVFGRQSTPETAETIETTASPTVTAPAAATIAAEGRVSPEAPTAEPTTTPDMISYVVSEGDTLSGIAYAFDVSVQSLLDVNNLADPNLIHPGQVLLIPLPPPKVDTATPAAVTAEAPTADASQPTPLPTPTSVGPPLVEVWAAIEPGNLSAETVVIRNSGGLVSLAGWTLSDNEGNVFIFPALMLFTDAEVRVHSAAGTPSPSDLFWGRAKPAWSRSELITLRDSNGEVVDTFVIP
jgi:LysM repeat protein